MVVETGNQLELLAPCLQECLAASYADFFQGFQTIGNERGADDQQSPLPLRGKLGLGYTFLSERPLRFSETSPRVNLLELSAGLSWWFLELGFQVFNVLDTRYAAQEFVFESDWNPNTPAPDQPARHIAAGAPRTLLFRIGFRL